MMIGQTEVMKITKIAEGCASRKAASESGSQASGGTVRSTWNSGSSPRVASGEVPISSPVAMPATAESAKPSATRWRLASRCQNSPLSSPPRSKNGSVMRSRESVHTLDGGGSVALGPLATSSHRPTRASTTRSGGNTVSTIGRSRAAREGRANCPGSETETEAAAGTGLETATFMVSGRGRLLNGKRGEVGGRVVRIEDLAVEEGLAAAAGAARHFGGGHAGAGGGGAPDAFAVHLVDQLRGVRAFGQHAPAHVLREEPQLVAAERIGGVVAPEFHQERRVRDLAAVAVVDVPLAPRQDVRHRHVEPGAAADDG